MEKQICSEIVKKLMFECISVCKSKYVTLYSYIHPYINYSCSLDNTLKVDKITNIFISSNVSWWNSNFGIVIQISLRFVSNISNNK